MLQIDLTSISSQAHYICFGLDNNELSSFEVQLWITKYGKQAVDWLERLSLGWVSFMRGDLWIQNQPETLVNKVNFFGEAKETKVGIVPNEQPNLIKVLDAIGIHSDGQWEVESITIPKTLNYPDGMSSRIPLNKFVKREGIWRAEFLRNMLSTDGTENVLDLLRGEELRSQATYIVLKNTDTSEVRLYKVDVSMQTSSI